MNYTRRDAMAIGAGAALATALPFQAFADGADDAIAAFTGGADIADTGVDLTAPEIAENGNTVPIAVAAAGATEIRVFAKSNPLPDVIKFSFGPRSGASMGATRCRLAGTQDIVAVAKMADGSFAQATANVKVTIGGCGG